MTPQLQGLIAALCTVLAVAGLALALAGMLGRSPDAARRPSRTQQRLQGLVGSAGTASRQRWWAARRTRAAASVAVMVVVWAATSWPVAGLLTGAAVWGMSWMLHPGREQTSQIQRLEGLEEWVRRLSDIHTVGISLDQAVVSSLRTVPAPIAAEVRLLVSRLGAGWRPEQAYRAFADDLNDSTADMVVALMLLHVTDRGAGLGRALTDLAASVSEEVLMRRKVEADRAKPRANARWVTMFCLVVFGLSFFSGSYVAPYHRWYGQVAMLLFAGVFLGLLVWMRRMANLRPMPRFLSPADRTTASGASEGTRP